MTKTNISKVITLVIIAALSVAFIDSTALADNASGVAYRTVSVDDVDIFFSYGSNPPLYPSWQKYLRENQPPTLIVWGEHDEIFPAAGAEPYKRDLKNLEYHLIDTGHFALETHGQEIADLMRDFLNRQLESPLVAN